MIESFFCVENVELVKLEIICYLILFDVIIWFEFKEKSYLERRLKSGICVWMNTTYSRRVRIERGKFHAFDGNYFEDLRKWLWKKERTQNLPFNKGKEAFNKSMSKESEDFFIRQLFIWKTTIYRKYHYLNACKCKAKPLNCSLVLAL